MSPHPNNTCSVPFLDHEKPETDEEPILEPQSPISPLIGDETGVTSSPSSNNIGLSQNGNGSRRESKTSGIISHDLIHQFILEPTLDEKKQLKLYQPDDDEDDSSASVTIPSQIWPQVLAAISVSLGSMIIGLISAYTSSALHSLADNSTTSLYVAPNGHEASWIGSLMPAGALAGSIIGGGLVEILGRKTTLLATGLPFIVAWLLIALASNIWMIYIARSIQGFCVGVASLCLPVYLAETVQPEVRGTLGLLPTTIGNIGLLVSFTLGTFLDWQHLAYASAALSIPFMVCMFLIPETPRWYVAKGKEKKAETALQWLRGNEADIHPELNEIKNTHLQSKKNAAKLKDLMGKAYIKPLLISLTLMFFQQFSGINALIFYSVWIFELAGSTVDPNLCTIIVGLVNFGATFMANLLIDRLGRKALLLISAILMSISLGILSLFFYLRENYAEAVSNLGWIPLASFMLFVVAFSLGFGPVPWLLLGEIFPGRIRGSAAACATAFNWICAFIITKAFPEIVALYGLYITFIIFFIITFIAIFFVFFCVTETKNKTLENIESNLTRPFRRLSSTANLKPSPLFM